MNEPNILRGVIHGRTIELDQTSGFAEGELVTVILQPVRSANGEGLKQAFGGWADDADKLDEFVEWSRQQRKQSRPEIAP